MASIAAQTGSGTVSGSSWASNHGPIPIALISATRAVLGIWARRRATCHSADVVGARPGAVGHRAASTCPAVSRVGMVGASCALVLGLGVGVARRAVGVGAGVVVAGGVVAGVGVDVAAGVAGDVTAEVAGAAVGVAAGAAAAPVDAAGAGVGSTPGRPSSTRRESMGENRLESMEQRPVCGGATSGRGLRWLQNVMSVHGK
ncbi:hypothetical protein GCM10025862_10590 [Arsenicicoccus piscis]|uniref:Uncharacterized protein n=1 Tax=Arsenicicoccus piscis TaxID=673954 RepID=A0ABQ6HLT5_9MICO|nr:hypothetical protein GCM10025862_10590 [Arsenicicoccus piscis]